MCTVLPLEGQNVSYVRLKFSDQITSRASVDTGSCAIGVPESLSNDLNLNFPKSLTFEKPSLNSLRMVSGHKVPIDKQNVFFSSDLTILKIVFLTLPAMNSFILEHLFLGNQYYN